MTIDEIIQALEEIRSVSPLGGETVVTLCRTGSGVANATAEKVCLETDGDGALVEILGSFEDDSGQGQVDLQAHETEEAMSMPYDARPQLTQKEVDDLLDADRHKTQCLGDLRLRGLSFAGRDLCSYTFRGSDLRDVDFTGAQLTFAYLKGADLRGSNLFDAAYLPESMSEINLDGVKLPADVPSVENIDQKILTAVTRDGQLDMEDWHSKTCGTAHCIAGWAVVLAGEAGVKLEQRLGTQRAAAMIFAASGVHPAPKMFTTNELAMEQLIERVNTAKTKEAP